jgi:hypothetical protein
VSFAYKTRSEQALEHLQTLKRPLTDEESDELRRSMHAVYERKRRQSRLAQHRAEELDLLAKLEREAQLPSPLA